MPQLIAYVAIEASALAANVAGAVGLSAAAIDAISVGAYYTSYALVSVGLSQAVTAALAPHPPDPNNKINVQQSLPPRRFGVGRCRVTGAYALRDAQKGILEQVILWPIGGSAALTIGRTWLNSDLVSVVDGAVQKLPDSRYNTGLVQIQTRQGLATETPYSDLTAEYGMWPFSARGDGIPSTWLRCNSGKLADFTTHYPAGPPEINEEHFHSAYDWRDPGQNKDDPATWAHTRNPVVWGVNVLWRAYGADWTTTFAPALADLTVEADVCDEPVERVFASGVVLLAVDVGATSVQLTTVEGLAEGNSVVMAGLTMTVTGISGNTISFAALPFAIAASEVVRWTVDPSVGLTEARYECGFAFDLPSKPSDILPILLASMDGWQGVRADGAMVFRAGRYTDPIFIFGDDEIIDISFNPGPTPDQAINSLTVSFTDPDAGYTAVETTQRRDEADVATRGEERAKPFYPQAVQSNGQVGRLALIALDQGLAANGSFRTPLSARRALGQRIVGIRCSDCDDVNDAVVEIVGAQVSLQTASIQWTYRLISAQRYAWDAAALEGPGPYTSSAPVASAAELPIITAAEAFFDTGGTARLRLIGTGPDRTDLTWWIGWRVTGDTAFVEAMASDLDPGSPVELETGVVPANATLEARLGYQTGNGSIIWSDVSVPIDTTPSAGAPNLPVITSNSGGAGAWHIAWLNPGDIRFAGARVHVVAAGGGFPGSTDVSGLLASGPGTPGAFSKTGVAPGTYDLFVTAENPAGGASPPAGPVTVTVT